MVTPIGKGPNKINRMRKIHTGTEWMFQDKMQKILKESFFVVPASDVRTTRDMIKYAYDRYVFPVLRQGAELVPCVAAKIENKLVVVNFRSYAAVQRERTLDTLLDVLMKNGAKMILFIAMDHLDSVVIAVATNTATAAEEHRGIKVVWKESASGKTADKFLEQTIPADKVAEFFMGFGMAMGVDPFAGIADKK